MAQTETEEDFDPFGAVPIDTGGFDSHDKFLGIGLEEEEDAYDRPPMLDIPDDTPDFDSEELLQGIGSSTTMLYDEDNDEEVVLPSRETLPSFQQNTSPTRPSREPTFRIPPEGLRVGELEDLSKIERDILDAINKRNNDEEDGKGVQDDSLPTSPRTPSQRPPFVRPALPEPKETTGDEPTQQYPPSRRSTGDIPVTGPSTDPLDYGKRPARAKRFFRDCDIGRDMVYQDHYGYPVELVPLAGFFIENPYAPLLDFGGGNIDFFGYPRDCPTGRPYGWLFDNMEVFVGTSGFGTRSDDIEDTSFGLHEGINWSGSFSPRFGLAAQFGVRAVQRTVNETNPLLEPESWNNGGTSQVFITTGIFRRAQSQPFQYGIVYDWMSDTKYRKRVAGVDAFNLGQVRTELSYRHCGGFTWGFRGAFGTTQYDIFSTPGYMTSAVSQAHGFFEKPLWCGSLAGFSAGGSAKGNAILSAFYDQPLSDKFSLKTGFTYMLPKDKTSTIDERNAWEAGITLTFHPHGGAFSKNCNPLRAMFDIAGNGAMIVSHRK